MVLPKRSTKTSKTMVPPKRPKNALAKKILPKRPKKASPKKVLPKRPKTAYWLWVEGNREKLFEECGTNSLMQCATVAGQKWKALGTEGQSPWKKKHDKLKAKYDKEMGVPSPKKVKTEPAKKKEMSKPPVAVTEKEGGDDEASIRKRLAKIKVPGKFLKMQYLLRIESNRYGGFQNVFENYDADGNGTLDVAEFTGLMRKAIDMKQHVLPDSHVSDLFAALDVDKSGSLDVTELQHFIDRGEATFFAGSQDSVPRVH